MTQRDCMPDKLPAHQLVDIERTTVGHYDENAESFWQGTRDHDVSQNYENFLRQFADDKPLDILVFLAAAREGISVISNHWATDRRSRRQLQLL